MNGIFTYEGRVGRAHFFGASVVIGLIAGILNTLFVSLKADSLAGVVIILAIVANSTFTVRRLHDIGRPGWHFWLQVIPLYNIYLGLILLFKKGDPGPNAYGDQPGPVAPTVPPQQ